jgi:hypothetical protein
LPLSKINSTGSLLIIFAAFGADTVADVFKGVVGLNFCAMFFNY